MSLGKNVLQLRKDRGWTQADLAERAQMRIALISEIEQDRGNPRLSTLRKLLDALQCSPNALLSEPTTTEGPQHRGPLYLVIDRLLELDPAATAPLVEVLDTFCIGAETAARVRQSPDRWKKG